MPSKPVKGKSVVPAPVPAQEAVDSRVLSPEEVVALNEQARLYPWVLFGCNELAEMTRTNRRLMTKVANHRDTPFQSGKKARPEWVVEFLHNPPKDFSTK